MNSQEAFLDSLDSLRDLPDHIIVESYKVIQKFLKYSEEKPIKLFLRESLDGQYSFQSNFKSVSLIEDSQFKSLTGYRYSSGVVAIFSKPQFIPEEDIRYPALILNGLTKVENVGAMVRTASAFGFKTLIIDRETCSPFLRRAIRVSMGNISLLKVHRSNDLIKFIENNNNREIFATANDTHSISYNDWIPSLESAVVIGSEGHGVDPNVIKVCNETIRIPIQQAVEHLNASAAAAIICAKYSLLLDASK